MPCTQLLYKYYGVICHYLILSVYISEELKQAEPFCEEFACFPHACLGFPHDQIHVYTMVKSQVSTLDQGHWLEVQLAPRCLTVPTTPQAGIGYIQRTKFTMLTM